MAKKRTPKFEEFTDGRTEKYAPPKYVAQPPVDDKGWEMFNAAFKNQKSYFKPGIKSINKDLKEHDYK